MLQQKIKVLIPFLFLAGLVFLLWRALFYANTSLPSALIGETVPIFQLPDLLQPTKQFTQNDLKGHVSLLNIWATWCEACKLEAPLLMEIKKNNHLPIYSIVYKDETQQVKTWLQRYGNPYTLIGDDRKGDVGIDLGIYGTPETFVISPTGKIIYRHVGVVDQKTWNEVLYPLVKQYE